MRVPQFEFYREESNYDTLKLMPQVCHQPLSSSIVISVVICTVF
jgi:hypothetical protein